LLFLKVNKTTIVVISAYVRFISTMPILLLGWVFACYEPSAFYLEAIAEDSFLVLAFCFFYALPPLGIFFTKIILLVAAASFMLYLGRNRAWCL